MVFAHERRTCGLRFGLTPYRLGLSSPAGFWGATGRNRNRDGKEGNERAYLNRHGVGVGSGQHSNRGAEDQPRKDVRGELTSDHGITSHVASGTVLTDWHAPRLG